MPRHREPTLAELVRGRAAEAPGTVAFVVDGGAPLTYADWERRSNAAALGLRDRQVGPGDRVVLWFDASRWADLAAAYAGVHKAGAVAVPLGSSLGAREVARVAADCRAVAVVTGGPRAALPGLPSVEPEELEAGQDGGALEDGPGPADPVELAYRCGFLTRPEARARSAPEVLSVLAATDGPGAPRSTIHTFAPGTAAATDALWSPLRRGRGPVVVLPAFDPDRFCALAAEHAVERWSLAPATALWLLQSGALDRHDPSPVGQVVLDGGRPSPSLLSRLAARLPGASVISVLGPAGARVPFVFEPDRPSSVGRPLAPGTQPERPEGEGRRAEREAGRRSGVTAAPDGEVLDTIASIWQRVLDRAGFGADDDFFELGGDQLAAVEMQSLVEDALEVRLPPSVVFDAPTVSALAAAVGRARGPAGTGSPPPVPVAASQEGIIWHEQFALGSQNLPPLVRRYRGPLDARVFETALGEIVRRHEPLRTTFELHEGRPVQEVAPPSPLSLPVRDLTDLPAGEQDDALAQALSDAGRPFDLVAGPLFEPTLLRLGGEDHIAVFRVHHSVYDDWSVSVFRRELSTLYAALA
ncbi:MAG TPA: AMP-binding protein, partial [Acidimicrobiales bacterium]|nr:AMP-binding protein [Acidimicrobiales bacterium]